MRAAIFQHLAIFILAVCAGGPPPVARADGSPEFVRPAIFDVGRGRLTAVPSNATQTIAGTAGDDLTP